MHPYKRLISLSLVLALLFTAFYVPSGTADAAEEATYEAIPVINAGFEEPVSGTAVPGWKTVPAAAPAGNATGVTGERAYAGVHSFLLDDNSASQSLALISSAIPVTAGETYRLSARIYVAQTSVRAYIKFFGETGKEVTPGATALVNTPGKWEALKLEGKAPAGAVKAEIWFYMGAAGTAKAYVDAVEFALRQPAPEEPLPLHFGAPVDLGEAVKIPLAQAAAYGQDASGRSEQYIAVTGSPAVFYAVDAESGARKFSAPLPGSDVVWAMTTAPDGSVYLAGTNDGKLYRYSPDAKRLDVVGVNPSDKFVWDLKASSDGKIYGATYPRSKVFEFDTASGAFRDLGSMMEGQQYARGLGVTDKYVYAGIGTKAHVIRYDRQTGEKKEIPLPVSGESGTIAEIDIYGGKLFINGGSKLYIVDEETEVLVNTLTYQSKISPPSPFNPDLIYYKLQGELYTYDLKANAAAKVEGIPELPADTAVKKHAWITLKQGEKAGQTVLAGMAAFTDSFFYNPVDGGYSLHFPEVDAQGVSVNALVAGDGDGNIYAGGYQRGLSIFNEASQTYTYTNKAFHQSEGIYPFGGKTYFGTYPGGKVYRYDPALPPEYNEYGAGNPGLYADIGDDQDRPFAMAGGDGKLFIGTFPSYGKLGGALTIVDQTKETDEAVTGAVYETYRNIVENQSIYGLAYRDGKLYGSTSVVGGLGVDPVEKNAKLFVFDVASRKKIKEFTPVIPGLDVPLQTIGELSFGPDGLLWGAVDGTIFAMNPDTYEIVKSRVVYPTTFGSSKYRPFYLRWGQDGLLYTTLGRKLTVVEPVTLRSQTLAEGTVNLMTLGLDGSVYYTQGSRLYRLPVLPTEAELLADKSELTRGETARLSVKVTLANGLPANLTGASVSYTSTDPAVASVDGEGTVTAQKAGTAQLGAVVTLHGAVLSTGPVTVRVGVTSGSLAGTVAALEKSGELQAGLAGQLLQAVKQAARHEEAGRYKQALHQLDNFGKKLEKGAGNEITPSAGRILADDAAVLRKEWENRLSAL
ncbi:Ig-like domain-containing protein [Paenibacillus chitinolyticus]|uniref:FIMAH domain-containing protein n=1 Tax=Paenibacillus chitinolyticus TaxID=79263 RepID=UPI002DBEDD91|nr:Ig-like domain-containing protein [Paenibacillus chitinolyticus]MEC0244845.1 Ig-like domain-containing protein [Paenibacillus chitinolyticus]